MSDMSEFDCSDEERLIRDSVRRMVQECRQPVVQGGQITAPGTHASHYLQNLESIGLSELVLIDGIDIPAVRRIAIVSEEAGAGLFLAPLAESLSTALIDAIGSSSKDFLKRTGVALMAFGEHHATPHDHLDAAMQEDGSARINGVLRRVPFAPLGDTYLLSLNAGGIPYLMLAEKDNPGITVTPEPLVDGTQRGEIRFQNCRIGPESQLMAGAEADTTARLLQDILLLSVSAQLIGVAGNAHRMACEHLGTRRAFGRTLSAFQALQHKAANDFVAVQVSRAFLYQLCDYWDEDSTRRPLLHGLVSKAGQTAIDTCKSAIQMHGAMGFTSEHEIGWHLKCAVSLACRYGDMSTHRRLFADHDLSFW